MTGVNGSCAANQRTDPDIWPGGTNALLMNGSSWTIRMKPVRPFGGLGRQAERDGQPGQRQHEQDGDTGRRQPPAGVGGGPEPQPDRDGDDQGGADQRAGQGADDVPVQHRGG